MTFWSAYRVQVKVTDYSLQLLEIYSFLETVTQVRITTVDGIPISEEATTTTIAGTASTDYLEENGSSQFNEEAGTVYANVNGNPIEYPAYRKQLTRRDDGDEDDGTPAARYPDPNTYRGDDGNGNNNVFAPTAHGDVVTISYPAYVPGSAYGRQFTRRDDEGEQEGEDVDGDEDEEEEE